VDGHHQRHAGHPAGEHHHAIVDVMLKRSILDPQGRAVQNTLQRLGHGNIVDLRVGKRIELTLTGDSESVRQQLLDIAESVLSNPVMEEVEVAMESHGG
jgi:phosphoribosylformylglycinamidine synthase